MYNGVNSDSQDGNPCSDPLASLCAEKDAYAGIFEILVQPTPLNGLRPRRKRPITASLARVPHPCKVPGQEISQSRMSRAFARQFTAATIEKTGGNYVMSFTNIGQGYKYAAVAAVSAFLAFSSPARAGISSPGPSAWR